METDLRERSAGSQGRSARQPRAARCSRVPGPDIPPPAAGRGRSRWEAPLRGESCPSPPRQGWHLLRLLRPRLGLCSPQAAAPAPAGLPEPGGSSARALPGRQMRCQRASRPRAAARRGRPREAAGGSAVVPQLRVPTPQESSGLRFRQPRRDGVPGTSRGSGTRPAPSAKAAPHGGTGTSVLPRASIGAGKRRRLRPAPCTLPEVNTAGHARSPPAGKRRAGLSRAGERPPAAHTAGPTPPLLRGPAPKPLHHSAGASLPLHCCPFLQRIQTQIVLSIQYQSLIFHDYKTFRIMSRGGTSGQLKRMSQSSLPGEVRARRVCSAFGAIRPDRLPRPGAAAAFTDWLGNSNRGA